MTFRGLGIVNPKYTGVTNDFALLLLEQPVPTIPATIASPFEFQDFFADGDVIVDLVGKDSRKGLGNDPVEKLLPVIQRGTAKVISVNFGSELFITTGTEDAPHYLEHGDSGGGTFYNGRFIGVNQGGEDPPEAPLKV